MMEEPLITNQFIKFEKGKIVSFSVEYLNFNEELWEKNKSSLIDWIENNHPDLKGAIYDQTEKGGIKLLKAIELFNKKNEKNRP